MTRVLRTARYGAILTFALAGLVCGTFTIRIPALTDKLDLSASSVGAVLLTWGIGALIAMQSMRAVMARTGSRTVLRIALPLCAATLFLVALAPSFPLLLAAVTLFGMSFGMVDVSMNAQGSTVERAYQRPVLNGMHAGWCVGAISAGALGIAAAAAGLSFTLNLALIALVAFPAALALGRTHLPDSVSAKKTAMGTAAKGRLPRVVYLLGAIAFAAFMVEGVVADWNGLFLRNTLGAPEALAALGYPIFEAGMLAGRLSGDRLRSRFGAHGLMTASGLATAATFLMVIVAPSAAIATTAMLLVGMSVAMITPLAMSLAGEATGNPGTAIAQAGAMGYAGLLLGPVVIGFLSDAASLRMALGTAIVLGLLIAALARVLPRSPAIGSIDSRTVSGEVNREPVGMAA